MNLRDWLAHREPSPPRVLQERVEALALAIPELPDDAAGSLLAAAEAALVQLARRSPEDRASALDLLAVDALVTYAMEYAAETPDELPALAERAMSRLSGAPSR